MMNRYPYSVGHLMVAPYRKTAELSSLGENEVHELWTLAVTRSGCCSAAMKAQGFNLGLNLGDSGGAGVADHLHWHIVPRWTGDTNFMPVLGPDSVALRGIASALREADGRTEPHSQAEIMPTNSTKPTWIEPPPPPKRGGMGCFGRAVCSWWCFILTVLVDSFIMQLSFLFRWIQAYGVADRRTPAAAHFPTVRQRIDQFEAIPPRAVLCSADTWRLPRRPGRDSRRRRRPLRNRGENSVLSAGEINGLISANPKSRGHAYVCVSGNTATVRVSIPSEKVPGFPRVI